MLKTVLLGCAMTISLPALAQDMPQQTAPSQTTVNEQGSTVPQGAPIAGAPVTETAPSVPAATAVTGETEIAQVVSTEFPTYDKNADKALDKAEFADWMVALKSASDPTTKASDPATQKWVDGAFASADTDKSKTVTQAELTTYLSQGAG